MEDNSTEELDIYPGCPECISDCDTCIYIDMCNGDRYYTNEESDYVEDFEY